MAEKSREDDSWMSSLTVGRSQELKDLVKPHLESFNYFLNEGLEAAASNLLPVTLEANEKANLPSARCKYA
jgi:hypothetical protein